MANRLKIAAISTGARNHGHNLSFVPMALITVVAAVVRTFEDKVQIRIFDDVIDGLNETLDALDQYRPDVLLVSVPVSGFYFMAYKYYFNWARKRGIPVLAGGHHFTVEGSQIPFIAAETEEIVVCYSNGELAAIGFIGHLLNPREWPLHEVPNICYLDQGVVRTNPRQDVSLGSDPYPVLPLEVFDPRRYWRTLKGTDVHESSHDFYNSVPIGRTAVGARVMVGCDYRSARLKAGKEPCAYCTLNGEYAKVGGKRFWELTRQMYEYVLSIPWEGDMGIRCYQAGDVFASDRKFVRDIWENIPDWAREAPLGHRAYAREVVIPELAQMLYDIGVRWLYIGADGKEGYSYEWSERHPLVRTLHNCREHGLAVSLGFVLGQRGQSWEDINRWKNFCQQLVKEFSDILIITDGWVNVVAPGSPDWKKLCEIDPSFDQTDRPSLSRARLLFIQRMTGLCKDGLSPEEALTRLYELVPEFENDFAKHPDKIRIFMLSQ